jgi:hypothetical protein
MKMDVCKSRKNILKTNLSATLPKWLSFWSLGTLRLLQNFSTKPFLSWDKNMMCSSKTKHYGTIFVFYIENISTIQRNSNGLRRYKHAFIMWQRHDEWNSAFFTFNYIVEGSAEKVNKILLLSSDWKWHLVDLFIVGIVICKSALFHTNVP